MNEAFVILAQRELVAPIGGQWIPLKPQRLQALNLRGARAPASPPPLPRPSISRLISSGQRVLFLFSGVMKNNQVHMYR